jgi:hypothetical protein
VNYDERKAKEHTPGCFTSKSSPYEAQRNTGIPWLDHPGFRDAPSGLRWLYPIAWVVVEDIVERPA